MSRLVQKVTVLGLVAIGLAAALITVVIVALVSVAGLNDDLTKSRADVKSLSSTVVQQATDLAKTRLEVITAKGALGSCSIAFAEQQAVSDELRQEAKQAVTSAAVLDSAALTALLPRIDATNEKEAAIDSSACNSN